MCLFRHRPLDRLSRPDRTAFSQQTPLPSGTIVLFASDLENLQCGQTGSIEQPASTTSASPPISSDFIIGVAPCCANLSRTRQEPRRINVIDGYFEVVSLIQHVR
jgi:hypothetical protein